MVRRAAVLTLEPRVHPRETAVRPPRVTATSALLLVLGGCLFKPSFDPVVNERPIAKLAAGRQHACAINGSGELWCWGSNAHGQLGGVGDSVAATGTPRMPDPLRGPWDSVAAGDRDTCAIQGGDVFCWGDRGSGQIMLDRHAVQVFAAPYGACAIDVADEVWCWGIVEPGVAPTGELPPPPSRLPLQDRPWRELAFAHDHACARAADGETVCWGSNAKGQLGAPRSDVAIDVADAVRFGSQLRSLAVGIRVTCSTTDDEVVCAGDNVAGLLSERIREDQYTDVPVTISQTWWSEIALGSDHACGITSEAGIACYGFNTTGALGNGFDFHLSPAVVDTDFAAPTEIVAGHDFTCARDAQGSVACWGANRFGELGNGEIASSRQPVLVVDDLMKPAAELVVGEGHTCIHVETDGIYCWGDNRYGQVAPTDSRLFIEAAERVDELVGGAFGLSAGARHTCGRTVFPMEHLTCWGDNLLGQLGGSDNPSTIEEEGAAWTSVAAGDHTTCGTKENGGLRCWGAHVDGSTIGWSQVAVGSGFVLGTLQSGPNIPAGFGTSVCPFGDVSTTPTANAPRTLGGPMTNPQLAAAAHGGAHACTRKTMAANSVELVCYGSNAQRQINNTPDPTCSPTPRAVEALPAPFTWSPIVAGQVELSVAGTHTCAVAHSSPALSARRLFCWGENRFGELGDLEDQGSPRQVNDVPVLEVATSLRHTCVIDTAKRVWCWGDNRYGELGNGKRFHAEPVRVLLP